MENKDMKEQIRLLIREEIQKVLLQDEIEDEELYQDENEEESDDEIEEEEDSSRCPYCGDELEITDSTFGTCYSCNRTSRV